MNRHPSTGDKISDFRVLETRPCPGLGGMAVLAEHTVLGTRMLHVHNEDEENLCAIVIPTPPEDDTGLPHIMEHSVLGGSKDYPLKDPFFEMVKTSLATFINAMTSTDYTVYPFSSVVKKDLFNLAKVYADAVFRPLIKPETFRREAWHFSKGSGVTPLELNGIVYNEMKAAYSSPESHIWRALSVGLFPDTLLRFESGGWPPAIPLLSYAQFKAFHEKWYAPQNALIFAYGNLATLEYAQFFSEKLKEFPAAPATAFAYPFQPRWSAPRETKAVYPVNPADPVEEKTYLSLAWLVSNLKDPFEYASWMVLFQILLGHDASPLKKALVDSGLGSDLSMSFLYPLGSELVFGTGLKGSEPGRLDKFRSLVCSVLEKCAEEGFTPDQIRTAVRQLSYQHLEKNQNFILNLLMNLVPVWMHADDPFTFLNMAQILSSVQNNAIGSPDLFSGMIRKGLLENPHRLSLSVAPDRGMAERTEKENSAWLEKTASGLGSDGLKKVLVEAEELDRLNAENDTPEKLRLLPRLALSDLPDTPWEVPHSVEHCDGRTDLLLSPMRTNGIFYAICDMDISSLSPDLYPYLPVFSELFQKMGAADWTWSETAGRKASAGRNFSCTTNFLGRVGTKGRMRTGLKFSFVSLEETLPEALDIFERLITDLKPSDFERLASVGKQYLAAWHDRILHNGVGIARAHSRRPYSTGSAADYLMSGVPGYELAKAFSQSFEEQKSAIVDACLRIRDTALASGSWTAAAVGPDRPTERFRTFLTKLSSSHPSHTPGTYSLSAPSASQVFEGISVPIRTSHSMITLPSMHASEETEPLIQLGAEVASSDYWLPRIRFKGGAYGARIGHDRYNAVWDLMSYADPDFRKTWQAFHEMSAEFEKLDLSRERLDQLVISALRPDINPLKPEQAGHAALSRFLLGETSEYRSRRYAAMRAASPENVKKAVKEHLEKNGASASFCVVGGPDQVKSASECSPDRFVRLEPLSS